MQFAGVWAALRWPELEHAFLSGSSRAPRLSSLAVLVLGGWPFQVSCRLTCDADRWVRRLAVAVSRPGLASRARLALHADGAATVAYIKIPEFTTAGQPTPTGPRLPAFLAAAGPHSCERARKESDAT
jgi:hypothetical protein